MTKKGPVGLGQHQVAPFFAGHDSCRSEDPSHVACCRLPGRWGL